MVTLEIGQGAARPHPSDTRKTNCCKNFNPVRWFSQNVLLEQRKSLTSCGHRWENMWFCPIRTPGGFLLFYVSNFVLWLYMFEAFSQNYTVNCQNQLRAEEACREICWSKNMWQKKRSEGTGGLIWSLCTTKPLLLFRIFHTLDPEEFLSLLSWRGGRGGVLV